MEHRLIINENINIDIVASQPYSNNYLKVKSGEQYNFEVDLRDKWTDWFIKTSANGFWNIFLRNKIKRVPNHRCFKLCGTIEKNEMDHFPIGVKKTWQSKKNGRLYFFANDSKKLNREGQFKYYNNNKGQIRLLITRKL